MIIQGGCVNVRAVQPATAASPPIHAILLDCGDVQVQVNFHGDVDIRIPKDLRGKDLRVDAEFKCLRQGEVWHTPGGVHERPLLLEYVLNQFRSDNQVEIVGE